MKSPKSIFILLIILRLHLVVCSQSNTIQKRINLSKSKNAYSYGIVETIPNNFVLIGQSIDSVGNQLQNRLTLAGVDNFGNLTWRKSYGGNSFAYQKIIGTTKHIIKHNGFLYSALSVVDSNSRFLGSFTKYDFNGDTIWQKKYYESNPTGQTFLTAVCPSTDNGFLMTGLIQTYTPGFNGHPTVGLYILKTNNNGVKIWDHTYYKGNLDNTQAGYDLIQDSLSKKIIIVGNQSQNSGGSCLITILDSLGNILIQKGGVGSLFYGSVLHSIIKSKDNNFIAIGSVDYPPENSTSYLVKFDTNAAIKFSHEYDSVNFNNTILNLIESKDGSIITGGVLELNYKYSNGINDVVRIMKLDSNGNFIWKKYFDNYTDNLNQDLFSGMCLSSAGDIAFTSFNPITKSTPLTFMFYRTDTSYCDVNSIACYNVTGVKENKFANKEVDLNIYPNPTTNSCNIQLIGTHYVTNHQIELINIFGESIWKKTNILDREFQIDLSNFSSGVYFVRILSDRNESIEKKLIITR